MVDYYEVVSGSHSRQEGARRVRYQVGDAFEATPDEVAAFGDKLRKVTKRVWGGVDLPKDEPSDFDVAAHSMNDVIKAVEAGLLTAEDALQAERAGKHRSTLIAKLEALADHGDAGQ